MNESTGGIARAGADIQPIPIEQRPARESSFRRIDALSDSFTGLLRPEFDRRGVGSDSRLACSVHINETSAQAQQLLKELGVDISDLDKFLDLVRQKGLNISLYIGGIAWTGDTRSPRESADFPGGYARQRLEQFVQSAVSLSEERLSPEEATEQKLLKKGKLPALEFLGRGGQTDGKDMGADICITLDPGAEDNQVRFLSSLRADVTAKSVIFEKIKAHGITAFESVYWSNGAFKEFQSHRAACEAVASDILWAHQNNIFSIDELLDFAGQPDGYKELLKRISRERSQNNGPDENKDSKPVHRDDVFDSGEEAYEYLEKLRGTNIIFGGAPATGQDLALPFKLTHSTPILREINDRMRRLTNWAILKGIGKVDRAKNIQLKKVPISNILLSRAAEMGRSRSLDPDLVAQLQGLGIWEMVFNAMRSAIGDGRFVCLADTSGSVVLSDRHSPAHALNDIYGNDIAIAVQTNDTFPYSAPVRSPVGREMVEVSGSAQHGELKRTGVIDRLRDIANWSRAHPGQELPARFYQGRYQVIKNLGIFNITNRLVRLYTG